jgi:hypothetical protein
VRIPNTLHLEYVQVARPLLDDVLEHPGAEVVGEPFPLPFDADGRLAPFEADVDASRRGPWEEVDGVRVGA